MKHIRFVTLLIITLFAGWAYATDPVNTYDQGGGYFSDPPRNKDKIAIRGYDTVAYFDSKDDKGNVVKGKPTVGDHKYTFEYQGAKWRFANQAHLDKFKAAPEKYAPQYGGYCAYGIAKGNIVKIEPDQFTVVNDKLYLNYDSDVNKDWRADKDKYIKEADAKFSKLIKN